MTRFHASFALALLFLLPSLAAAADEPATVEAAARMLDLRTFPVMEGTSEFGMRTLGMLMYEGKGDAKTAFEFQRKQLKSRGWKELPGGYQDPANASGSFSKEGYLVAASTSNIVGDPKKKGWSHVSVISYGNVALGKLPVPPGVKPFNSYAGETSYLTDAKVSETAEACRKLLLASGWEPYGAAGDEVKSPMLYFKRNAVRLMVWVSTAPAKDNKTVIRYSSALLTADLPAPPDAPDPRFNETDKTLRYDWPGEDFEPVASYYQKRLPQQGWKATTDRPVSDDKKRTQFLIFRNPQGDMISLDMERYTDIVRVLVRHRTAAEVAELDRLAKDEQERARQEMAKKNIKTDVEVPLPGGATSIEQEKEELIEFKLPTGSGPAALNFYKEHFAKQGWKEDDGTQTAASAGGMSLIKDEAKIRVRYFDTTITPAEITVIGSRGLVLKPISSRDNPPLVADTPPGGKKPGLADLPGASGLPPGVDLSDVPEAAELLKTLKKAEDIKRAAGNKLPKKQAAPASGAVKVADISIPKDVTSLEYSKTTKMISLSSASDVKTLANFFIDDLGNKGWQTSQKPTITDSTAILKLENGQASLTIFVHGRDIGTDATLMSKGVAWDVVPPSKIATKKPPKKSPEDSAADSSPTDRPKPPAGAPRVGPRITLAEQKQTGSTLWAGGKVFKLDYGVAYESKQGDEIATEVMLSTKPIAVDKLAALLSQGKDGGDAGGFDPHMRLRFDASGKLGYLFLYAEGLSVNQSGQGEDVVKAEIAVADGRARGKAVMEKPGKLFDNEYRFDANFDAKLATSRGAPGDPPPTDPAAEALGAEEQDGIPYPLIAENRSSSGSRFRQSVTAEVPAPLPAVVDFYRKELTARGWKEDLQAGKAAADSAQLVFAGPDVGMTVKLSKHGDGVAVNLAVRYPAKAKTAGILPQPNRGRLILGNGSSKEAMVVINGQQYKVAAGVGAQDPKDGTSLHVQPGKYICKIKVPGQPEASEELTILIGETWGLIILPTGGHFADQVY